MDLKKLLAFLLALGLSELFCVRAEDDEKDGKKDDDDEDDEDLDAEDSADEEKQAEEVVALTDKTFKDFVKTNQYVVVEFYAPWCGHCKALTPEYEAAAKELKKRKRKTKLAKVDATVESGIASEYGVQGYPTLFYFADGVKSEYGGGRTKETILSWVEARERDVLEECDDAKIKKLTGEEREESDPILVVVGKVVKKSGKHSAVKKAMSKLLAEDRISPYVACVQYLPKGTDEKKEASLVLHKMNLPKSVDRVVKFSMAFSQGNVYSFLTGSPTHPASPYDSNTWKGSEKNLVLVIEDGKTFEDDEKEKLFKLLSGISSGKKYPGFTFGWDDKTQSTHLGDASSKEGKKIVITSDGKKYYKVVKEFKKDEVESYLKEFVGGKLKPTYKTAQLTETHEKNVQILVGSNFADIALSSKKDVFVKFYAPWCGHCKALVPVWEELADKVKDMGLDKKVVIAKFDATENECEIQVDGYPKLIFFPAVKNSIKKKMEFQGGDRTADKFVEFLAEHAKNMEGMDLPGEKIDKKSFSIVDRELAKKKNKAEL